MIKQSVSFACLLKVSCLAAFIKTLISKEYEKGKFLSEVAQKSSLIMTQI